MIRACLICAGHGFICKFCQKGWETGLGRRYVTGPVSHSCGRSRGYTNRGGKIRVASRSRVPCPEHVRTTHWCDGCGAPAYGAGTTTYYFGTYGARLELCAACVQRAEMAKDWLLAGPFGDAPDSPLGLKLERAESVACALVFDLERATPDVYSDRAELLMAESSLKDCIKEFDKIGVVTDTTRTVVARASRAIKRLQSRWDPRVSLPRLG